jgi:predicted metalloprotease
VLDADAATVRRSLALLLAVTIVAALVVAATPSFARERVGRPTRKDVDKLIKESVDNIQAFWTDTMPDVYGKKYKRIPKSRIRPYGKTTDFDKLSKCTKGRDYEPNARYCPLDDTIVYDAERLFPALFDNTGPFTIPFVLAHEWGHAIQRRFGLDFENTPTVLFETQADCFAGSWAAHLGKTGGAVRSGGSGLRLERGDLDVGLSGLLQVSDPTGSGAAQAGAHGSGFDRVNAFQEGFRGGARRCREWYDNPPQITEFPFRPGEAIRGGNLPFEDVIPTTVKDLDLYWSQLIPNYKAVGNVVGVDPSRPSRFPDCGGDVLGRKDIEGAVVYCAPDNYIAYDSSLIRNVYRNIGDFGDSILISNAWASAMQVELGIKGNDQALRLQRDCFSGSWAGSIPPIGNRNAAIQLSAGDLDEVVQSFLAFDRATDQATDTAFDRVQAFRTGFFESERSCLNRNQASG